MEIAHAGLAQLAKLLEQRKVSAVELAQLYLQRIERHRALNAFLDVRPDLTLQQARAADGRRARGDRGPLLGMPIDASYGLSDQVKAELDYARRIFDKHPHWPVIDVTGRAIEETAVIILESLKERDAVKNARAALV